MRFFVVFVLILLIPTVATAMPWEDIVPLSTTRNQVLRKLGNPLPNEDSVFEHFRRADILIKIRYIRADCYEDVLEPTRSNESIVVRQITVIPDKPLETTPQDEVIDRELSAFAAGPEMDSQTFEGLATANRFLKYYVNCSLGAKGSGGCSMNNGKFGFGMSTGSGGITSLYFTAGVDDWEKWKSPMKPC